MNKEECMATITDRDLFEDSISDDQIAAIWDVMANAPHLMFLVETLHPERMQQMISKLGDLSNVYWVDKTQGDRYDS